MGDLRKLDNPPVKPWLSRRLAPQEAQQRVKERLQRGGRVCRPSPTECAEAPLARRQLGSEACGGAEPGPAPPATLTALREPTTGPAAPAPQRTDGSGQEAAACRGLRARAGQPPPGTDGASHVLRTKAAAET